MKIIKNIGYIFILFVSMFIFNSLVNAYNTYSIGQEVEYNGIKFYVIKDSSSEDDSVTMLKVEPLTVEEVNTYGGVETDDNHVNKYTAFYQNTAVNQNGYGGMTYYSSEDCGHVNDSGITSGCTNDYSKSDIKYVVDAWARDNLITNYLELRLINLEDLVTNLGYEYVENGSSKYYEISENTPKWIYNANYSYWTMTQGNDANTEIMYITNTGQVNEANIVFSHIFSGVRPVIKIKKSVIESEKITDNNDINSEKNKDINEISFEKQDIINVPNTMQKISIVLIMIGVILVSISIVIIVKTKK